MSKSIRFIIVVFVYTLALCFLDSPRDTTGAAESKPGWQAEWEKTLKAAEDEGALVIYMTQAFEPVFREVFQKNILKSK